MEKFYSLIEIDTVEYPVKFEPIQDDILNELYFIVTCKGFPPFIIAYDFENASGLKAQGNVPYLFKEHEELFEMAIEDYNNGWDKQNR